MHSVPEGLQPGRGRTPAHRVCDSPNRGGIIGTSLDESKCRARPLAPPAAGIPPGAFGPWEGSTQGANGGRYPSRPAHEARHAGRGAPGLRGRGRKLCSRGSGARPQGSELCAQGKKPCTRPKKVCAQGLSFARELARKEKALRTARKALRPRLRALPERFQSLTAGQKARRERLRGSAARLGGLGPRRKASRPALGASVGRLGAPASQTRRKAGDAARPPAPSPRPVRRDGTRCNEPLKFLPFTLRSLPKDSDDGAVENRLRACASAPTLDISVPCFAAVLDSTRACTS